MLFPLEPLASTESFMPMSPNLVIRRPCKLPARVAEAALIASRIIELSAEVPIDTIHPGDNQLGNSITPMDDKRALPKIDEADLDLAAVVAVDRTRGVNHRQPMSAGEAATGPDLTLEAGGNGDRDSRGHQGDLLRRKSEIGVYCRMEIHPGGVRAH